MAGRRGGEQAKVDGAARGQDDGDVRVEADDSERDDAHDGVRARAEAGENAKAEAGKDAKVEGDALVSTQSTRLSSRRGSHNAEQALGVQCKWSRQRDGECERAEERGGRQKDHAHSLATLTHKRTQVPAARHCRYIQP